MLTGPGPTADERELLLTIAARVPDHGKLAPFRFIVFEGAAREKASAIIAEVFAKANPEADQASMEIEQRFPDLIARYDKVGGLHSIYKSLVPKTP